MTGTRNLNRDGSFGDLNSDVWGYPIRSERVSLFHGLWTFDIPQSMWLVYEDDTEIVPASVTGVASTNGAGVLDTGAGGAGTFSSVLLTSKRHPRYQPNRGHHFATALLCPDAGNDGTAEWGLFTDNAGTIEDGAFFRLEADGTLSAVVVSNGVEVYDQAIDTSGITGFDVTKGNLYDLRWQWRGVGDYFWYINLQLVHKTSLLGSRTGLSIRNPAMPVSYKVTNTTEDQSLVIGCVDVTSEAGSVDREQYSSYSATASTGGVGEVPILSIYNPPTISSRRNTRDIRLQRVTVSSAARILATVYKTRDPAALTGEVFTGIGGGSYVEYDTTASAVVPANATKITAFRVEANGSSFVDNPDVNRIDFYVTHGDYIIVTAQGSNTTVDVTIEWGEEI